MGQNNTDLGGEIEIFWAPKLAHLEISELLDFEHRNMAFLLVNHEINPPDVRMAGRTDAGRTPDGRTPDGRTEIFTGEQKRRKKIKIYQYKCHILMLKIKQF